MHEFLKASNYEQLVSRWNWTDVHLASRWNWSNFHEDLAYDNGAIFMRDLPMTVGANPPEASPILLMKMHIIQIPILEGQEEIAQSPYPFSNGNFVSQ